jgi:hypothetical protein
MNNDYIGNINSPFITHGDTGSAGKKGSTGMTGLNFNVGGLNNAETFGIVDTMLKKMNRENSSKNSSNNNTKDNWYCY